MNVVTDAKGTDLDLVAALTPAQLVLYEADAISVSVGQDAKRPVVRWANGKDKGRFAPGSGVVPAHVDKENGIKSRHKQLPEYRALLARLIEATEDPDIRGSFAWIVDQMFEAIEGAPITKECPECGHEVYMYKKPDITAAKYLIDQVADKPTHRQEINIDMESRHLELSATFDPTTLTVHRIDPQEERRRRKALDVEYEDVTDADED